MGISYISTMSTNQAIYPHIMASKSGFILEKMTEAFTKDSIGHGRRFFFSHPKAPHLYLICGESAFSTGTYAVYFMEKMENSPRGILWAKSVNTSMRKVLENPFYLNAMIRLNPSIDYSDAKNQFTEEQYSSLQNDFCYFLDVLDKYKTDKDFQDMGTWINPFRYQFNDLNYDLTQELSANFDKCYIEEKYYKGKYLVATFADPIAFGQLDYSTICQYLAKYYNQEKNNQ